VTASTPIAKWCMWAMRSKGWSQAKLAGAMGVTKQAVSLWVRGERRTVSEPLQRQVYRALARVANTNRRTPLTPAEFESGPPRPVKYRLKGKLR